MVAEIVIHTDLLLLSLCSSVFIIYCCVVVIRFFVVGFFASGFLCKRYFANYAVFNCIVDGTVLFVVFETHV